MEIILVAALAQNRIIGKDGALPWSLPDDLQHFKKLTLHKPIVMGHTTAKSLRGTLQKRTNLVLSHNVVTRPGFTQVCSREEAIAFAEKEQAAELCVIGGAQIYSLFMPVATRLELTHVRSDIDGDVLFPDIDMSQWVRLQETRHEVDERHAYAFQTASYVRRAAAPLHTEMRDGSLQGTCFRTLWRWLHSSERFEEK